VLDGTPLLDIKPYIPEYDSHPGSRAGWMDSGALSRTVADDRFHS
jgi:tRNA (Thr-GGU) A37 N-methylase